MEGWNDEIMDNKRLDAYIFYYSIVSNKLN